MGSHDSQMHHLVPRVRRSNHNSQTAAALERLLELLGWTVDSATPQCVASAGLAPLPHQVMGHLVTHLDLQRAMISWFPIPGRSRPSDMC